jgi:hypothetical protein
MYRIEEDAVANWYYEGVSGAVKQFSVMEIQQDGSKKLVDCCLTQVEAALIVELLTRR